MSNILEQYPKVRNTLPKAYQEIYEEYYRINRDGDSSATSLSQKMETWLHKKVAKDLISNNKSTLEIGAGTLNQLDYENTQPYDIIEPFKSLYQDSKHLKKVRAIYEDIDDVPKANKYDRITSIATFEHILDLPKVVAKAVLMLNHEGTLRVSIPNEGTIMWKLGYKLTTAIEFKMKYKLDYQVLMDYEHVNTAKDVEEVLKVFFNRVKVSCFGLNRTFAFYRYLECSEPNIEKAEKYLKDYSTIKSEK